VKNTKNDLGKNMVNRKVGDERKRSVLSTDRQGKKLRFDRLRQDFALEVVSRD
jgi:hypothetical protein